MFFKRCFLIDHYLMHSINQDLGRSIQKGQLWITYRYILQETTLCTKPLQEKNFAPIQVWSSSTLSLSYEIHSSQWEILLTAPTDDICSSIHLVLTSLVAHWRPATTLSLISFKYWTPLVTSTRRLGPVPSGPKAQILRASVTSHSKLSASFLPRSLGSVLGVISPCKGPRCKRGKI